MRTVWLMLVMLGLAVSVAQAEWPQQSKLLPSDGGAGDVFGFSVAINGDYAAVASLYDDDKGTDAGAVYVYQLTGSNWTQLVKLTASDGAAGDQFGHSVSMSGDYLLIGSRYDDPKGTSSGSAYVFQRSGASWTQAAKLTAASGSAGDIFGHSVSINGNYAIVGAHGTDATGTNSGAAYVFQRSGTSWTQMARLTPADAASGDVFGHSVSISGDYAVVGAQYDDARGSDSGSAYVFQRSGTTWSQVAKLTANDGVAGDWFGYTVSLSGDYALVGAYMADANGSDSGAAYMYQRSGSGWSQIAKLIAPDGEAGDWFGGNVSLCGDNALLGATSFGAQGAAYAYQRVGTDWILSDKLLALDGATGDQFGNFVALSNEYAIVGADASGDFGASSGSAYIFQVPEPATLSLLVLGLGAVFIRKGAKR